MGFDCTLHVVDEASVHRFVDRFLDRSATRAPFDRAYADADALIAAVRSRIARDPEEGGRVLGELALLWVSAETPHACSRGFALSLWEPDGMGAELPLELLGSIEPLLGDIVAAYSRLARRVPRFFDGNYCVGPFVRARDVPALLAFVERALEALVPGERRPYEPLRRVLRVAAERRMAYWEGTDFGVAQAHEEWLTPPPRDGVEYADAPFGTPFPAVLAHEGDRLLVSTSPEFTTWVVDVSTFPPRCRVIDGLATRAGAFSPWGTIIMSAATDAKRRPYSFALHEESDGVVRKLATVPPFQIETTRTAGDRVVLFPSPDAAHAIPGVTPLALRRGGAIEPIGAPPASGGVGPWGSLECDAIGFGDGSALVVWNGATYRWRGGALDPLGDPLGRPEGDLPSGITLSDGSIATFLGRRLVNVRADGVARTILPLENVMGLSRAPDDALVIHEGDNVEGDALKVWWSQTRELTRLAVDAIGLAECVRFAVYAANRLLVFGDGAWRALAWVEVEAMPRVPERAFLVEHEALTARAAKQRRSVDHGGRARSARRRRWPAQRARSREVRRSGSALRARRGVGRSGGTVASRRVL